MFSLVKVIDIDGGKVEKELSDSSAAFQERSYLIPANKKDAINVRGYSSVADSALLTPPTLLCTCRGA